MENQTKALKNEQFVESLKRLGLKELSIIVENELNTVLKESDKSTASCDNAIQFYEVG